MKILTNQGEVQVDYFGALAPVTSGVYLLMDGDDVVYVGMSGNIKNRIAQHRSAAKGRKGRDIKKPFDCIAVINVAGQNTAMEIERDLVFRLRPKFNTTHAKAFPHPRTEKTGSWEALYSNSARPSQAAATDTRCVHAPRLGVKPPPYLPGAVGSMCGKWSWSDDDRLAADIAAEVTCANCLRVIEREEVAA